MLYICLLLDKCLTLHRKCDNMFACVMRAYAYETLILITIIKRLTQ